MLPRFLSVESPLYSLKWVDRGQSPHVLFCGGGGKAKSGVKNLVKLAKLSETESGAPQLTEVARADTGEDLCVCVDADPEVWMKFHERG